MDTSHRPARTRTLLVDALSRASEGDNDEDDEVVSSQEDVDASFKLGYDNQQFVPIDTEFLIEHDRLEQLAE